MGKVPRWLIPLVTGQALPCGHGTVWAALLLVTTLLDEAFAYEPCLSELKVGWVTVLNCPTLRQSQECRLTVLKLLQSQPTFSPCSCSLQNLRAQGAYAAHMDGERSSPAHLWASISVTDSTANLSQWNPWSLFLAATVHSDSSLVNLAFSPNYTATLLALFELLTAWALDVTVIWAWTCAVCSAAGLCDRSLWQSPQ